MAGDAQRLRLLLATAAAVVLAVIGAATWGGDNDLASGAGDRSACQAIAGPGEEPPNPYRQAVDEWNAHSKANDAEYRRYTNAGGFEAWAKAKGFPTEPVPTPEATGPSAGFVLAMPDLSSRLRRAVKGQSEAMQSGDMADAFRWYAAKQAICKELGVEVDD